MKLYKVSTCEFSSYVVGESMDQAAKAFENWLDKKSYGFMRERRVVSVTEEANTDVSPAGDVALLILDYPHPDIERIASKFDL